MTGNPQFRFILSHDINGTIEISEPLGWSSAVLKLERHEDFHSLVEYFDGAFTFYGSDGGNINGGIDWIKSTELQFGFDTTINILIEVSFDEGETFEEIFSGQLDLTGAQELKDNKIEIPIIRNSLWSNFIARQDVPVNIQSTTDLDGNTVVKATAIELKLPSQNIRKMYSGYVSTNFITKNFSGGGTGNKPYHIIEYDVETFDEITQKYTYPMQESDTIPFGKFTLDYAGTYQIISKITFFKPITSGVPTGSTIPYIKVYLQINGDPVIEFTATDRTAVGGGQVPSGLSWTFNELVTDYTIDVSLILHKSDTVRIYANMYETSSHISNFEIMTVGGRPNIPQFNFEGYWDPTSGLFPTSAPITGFMGNRSWILSSDGILQGVPVLKGWTIYAFNNTPGQSLANWYIGKYGYEERAYAGLGEAKLTVIGSDNYPNTQCDGFLLHDVASAICDRITGKSDSFYSEILGSDQTIRNYSSNGCFWKNMLVQGLQIRGYYLSTKQFSVAFSKWWKGGNPIFNLGIGYDTINGSEVIRCEGKEFFYDKTSASVYIDNVREIVREYDPSRIWNQFEFGYSKWESENISGIDDPQTKRTWTDVIKKIKNTLTLYSEFIAASYAIETTRRTTIAQSSDYKYDNDIFIIAVTGDAITPDAYDPELIQNFKSVSNLFASNTRYNLALTPMRNLLRWGNYISGCLQNYKNSTFKFTSGEGNYAMVSDYNFSTGEECIGILGGEISERENIEVFNFDAIHLPNLFTITIDLSWDDYLSIRNNRTKAIAVSQTETGHKKFFIKTLEYTICKSEAKITMWATEMSQIDTIETTSNSQNCDSVLRITEDNQRRITEDGINRRV